MAYWNLLLWDPTELDEVQSLKKWEGLPFCNHHSLLIHDTHSARENSAHAVSSSRGGGGVSGVSLKLTTCLCRAVPEADLPCQPWLPLHATTRRILMPVLAFQPAGLFWVVSCLE